MKGGGEIEMWKCEIENCREYFATERAFVEHMCRKHEQEALERWVGGGIFDG